MPVSTQQARKAMERIAQENGISIFEVRREIEKAIEEGMKSTDPNAVQFWKNVLHEGATPTPEEVMVYLAHMVK